MAFSDISKNFTGGAMPPDAPTVATPLVSIMKLILFLFGVYKKKRAKHHWNWSVGREHDI